MDVSRRSFLGAIVAGTALTAGCAGGSSTPTETAEPTATEMPTATEGAPGTTVEVRSHADLGEILVGPEGLTLYMFDQDTQDSGASSCAGGCADNWPPLTVDGEPTTSADVTASLSTFEREDGTTQVAANGWPLYYFTPDEEPGDASGQGVNDVWWVLRPDGAPVRGGATETDRGY